MMPRSEINRLIKSVSASAEVMETGAFEAVCDFVRKSQTESGAFVDRGGHPDWYYSFFGFLICKAFDLKPELQRLQQFVMKPEKRIQRNLIDWAVWVLLNYSFKPNLLFKLKISIRLAMLWIRGRQPAGQVYPTFLSLLILNHFWGYVRCISKQTDRLTSAFIMNDHSPTSHLAASVLIRNQAGLTIVELSQKLMKCAHAEGGFVSFSDHGTADMLSTAVAIYALTRANISIGTIRASGLDFVSRQFDNGAFLSGDGDTTRDLEYTFYGLLALSSYTQQLSGKQ